MSPLSMRAWRTHLARVLLGTPSRWATALQVRPSAKQSSTASCFCSAVNWRLVLVGLVIDRQSEGHGMSPIDLSTIAGLAQGVGRTAPNRVQRRQTAFGSPGAYTPGGHPAMEGGLIKPLTLIRIGAAEGVTSASVIKKQGVGTLLMELVIAVEQWINQPSVSADWPPPDGVGYQFAASLRPAVGREPGLRSPGWCSGRWLDPGG